MPQDSLRYAVGRVRMLRRHLLKEPQFARLLSAQDEQEALKLLTELGYLKPEQTDLEQASVQKAQQAALLIRQLSPEPKTTDSFLMRFDAHNLKVLLKARLLNLEPEGLSPAGTLDAETLRHAVSEHRYTALPKPLKETMQALEQRVAMRPDPMEIDVLLDRAIYRMMQSELKHSSSPAAREWLQAGADFVNLRSFLRLSQVPAALNLQDILVEGGSLSRKEFMRLSGVPELLISQYRRYGAEIHGLAEDALQDRQVMGSLELRMERYLRGLFAKRRNEVASLDVLIDYLMQVEEESATLRLMFAGKRLHLSQEDIEERLRSLHG